MEPRFFFLLKFLPVLLLTELQNSTVPFLVVRSPLVVETKTRKKVYGFEKKKEREI